MPSKPRKHKGVYVELPPDLVEKAKAFGEKRGEGFKDVVVDALQRHLAYPPSPPAPEPYAPKPKKKGK